MVSHLRRLECLLLDHLNVALQSYYNKFVVMLMVRVSGYRYRGPGFDPRRYQIF